MSRSPDVDAFVKALGHPAEGMIMDIRALIRSADAEIAESIKWNAPSFATSEHFATFNLRAKHGVQLVVHLGTKTRPGATVRAAVDPLFPGLEWKAADRALIHFRDAADVRVRGPALQRLIKEWIRHVGA